MRSRIDSPRRGFPDAAFAAWLKRCLDTNPRTKNSVFGDGLAVCCARSHTPSLLPGGHGRRYLEELVTVRRQFQGTSPKFQAFREWRKAVAIAGGIVSENAFLLGTCRFCHELGSKEAMRIKTLVIGYALALALLLFAQRRPDSIPATNFTGVVDLTHPVGRGKVPSIHENAPVRAAGLVQKDGLRRVSASTANNTNIDSPARLVRGMWTVDQIPPERLIAPLTVLDVTSQARRNPDYEVSVEDIAQWEQIHGEIPAGAVVVARTGWGVRWSSPKDYRNTDKNCVMHFP